MIQIGSYGAYWTYYNGDRQYPDSQVGCMVVGVKNGGAILRVQPMIQGADAKLEKNHRDPIEIPAGDFVEMPQLAPIGAG